MNKIKLLLAGAILTMLALVPVKSMADSFNVYVGYTDSLRASGFFPTPFCSGWTPNCQIGTSQALDGGAIWIQNTGATPISITNLSVYFPSPGYTFNFWTSVAISAGGSAFFGQTSQYNFDTSDFGVFGALPPPDLYPGGSNGAIGGCSSPAANLTAAEVTQCNGAIPVISFLENGNPVSFSDTGQILDTGGYDFVNLSSDGNESINWNSVGTVATRSGNVPEPGTLVLLGSGLLGLAGMARKRFKS